MPAAKKSIKVRQVNVQIAPNTPFKELVKQLEIVLTLPKGVGPRGCSPCLSGLDRFVLESKVLSRIG